LSSKGTTGTRSTVNPAAARSFAARSNRASVASEEIGDQRLAGVGALLAGRELLADDLPPGARIADQDGAAADRRHVHRQVMARTSPSLSARKDDRPVECPRQEITERLRGREAVLLIFSRGGSRRRRSDRR